MQPSTVDAMLEQYITQKAQCCKTNGN